MTRPTPRLFLIRHGAHNIVDLLYQAGDDTDFI
jgi:hypothetical protein